MTKIISGLTKRGQQLKSTASRYEGYYLDDVYDSFSAAKARAWRDCLAWCESQNGYNFHICSHNSMRFTVAWNYTDPETGEIMTRIETADNTYIVDSTTRREDK